MATKSDAQNHEEKSSDEISLGEIVQKLQELFKYLLSKWIILIIFSILGAAIGVGYSLVKKPTYIATSTFVLEEGDRTSGLSQYAGLASMAGIDVGVGGDLFQGDNIVDLYKSRSMIEKTLLTKSNFKGKDQLLIDSYIQFNKLRENWNNPELKNMNFFKQPFSRLQDSVMGVVVKDINKNYLSVGKPEKKLAKIQVDVKATDEVFAKDFNEKIVENVNEFYIFTKVKKSKENVAILQRKTDSVRVVMRGAIFNAASIADATPNLNPTRQAQRTAPIQQSQFNAESNRAILAELLKNLELSKISIMKETPLIQIIDKPIFPLEKERLGKIKAFIIGGFLAFLLITIILLFKRLKTN